MDDNLGLTEKEKECLNHLKDAWNLFVNLEGEANFHEFIQGIHICQQVIALRVAKRVNPEVWL